MRCTPSRCDSFGFTAKPTLALLRADFRATIPWRPWWVINPATLADIALDRTAIRGFLFTLAAAPDYIEAQKGRDAIASDMTPDQIAEAQRMAREWVAKHQQ